MKNLRYVDEAVAYKFEVFKQIYTSSLIGKGKSPVLHGGENTATKIVKKISSVNKSSVVAARNARSFFFMSE